MERAGKIKQKAEQIIKKGEKPSAKKIAEQLEYSVPDVHRCLNHLEKNKEIQTYRKKVFNTEHRMISVKRQ